MLFATKTRRHEKFKIQTTSDKIRMITAESAEAARAREVVFIYPASGIWHLASGMSYYYSPNTIHYRLLHMFVMYYTTLRVHRQVKSDLKINHEFTWLGKSLHMVRLQGVSQYVRIFEKSSGFKTVRYKRMTGRFNT